MLNIHNLLFGAFLILFVDSKCIKTTNSCSKNTNQQKSSNSLLIEYLLFVDSGDSATRFYIYKNTFDDLSSINDTQIELLKCTADGGGLHTKRDKEEIRNNFRSCMNKIKSTIPEEKHPNTLIDLTATSGMRLLNVKNNQRVDQIFSWTYEVLEELGFYQRQGSYHIVKSRDEGLFASLQANIISNNMKKPVTNAIGIMDLGSGSVQLTYNPKETNKNSADFYNTLAADKTVNNFVNGFCPHISYSYSTSQDCYGQNEFRFMYYAYLIANHVLTNKSTLDINSACLPKNSRIKLSDNFYNSICTIWQLAPAAVKIEKNILSKYTFVGEGNSEKCQEEIKSLMETRGCINETCTFQGEFQPPVDNIKFKAINGFYFAIDNAKRLLKKEDEFTMEEFRKETDNLCAKTVQELAELNNNNNDGQLDDEFVLRQCFLANYILEILKNNGFKSFGNIDFVRKVNGLNFGWTLGAAFIASRTVTSKDTYQDIHLQNLVPESDPSVVSRNLNSKALKTIVYLIY